MKHLYVETNNLNVFVIQIFVKAGSVYENDGEHGLSHLLEHMMFKSKANLPVQELLVRLVGLGGVYNAITNKDYTCYFIRTIADKWKESIDILSKVVFEPHFLDKELQKEIDVVIQEFMMYEDDIKEIVFNDAYEMMMKPNNPYRKSVKGTLSNIRSATPATLVEYHKKHYGQCMAYLNAPANLKSKVKDYLEGKLGNKLSNWTFDLPKATSFVSNPVPRISVIEKERAQNATLMAFSGFPAADVRNITLDFIWYVLAGSLNSLLMMEIRENKGWVYGLSAFNDVFACVGVTGLYFTSSGKHVNSILAYVCEILSHTKQRGFSADLLGYSKAAYINKLKYRLSNFDYTIDRSMTRLYYGCKFTETDIQQYLDNLTNDQVKEVARDVFQLQNMSIVAAGNFGNNAQAAKAKIQKRLSL